MYCTAGAGTYRGPGEVSNMKITTAADYKIAQIMAENGELNTENS